MNITRTSDLWWKNAVFYCIDAEMLQDGNGDGIGDFHGLTRRMDYLAGLGITCLWLMPFFPSPNRDDGYDIADYYSVDPRLGSLGDFVECVRTARDRGIRVIIDLVVNHTSAEHPWFQSARSDPNSRFRDWYVWRDSIPEDGPEGLVFPGQEESNWEWDEAAGQYFLHRFYRHQPDLNIANPNVREEIRKIVGFWLELGVSGFRVDAVPFLLETGGILMPMELAPHEWMRDLRAFTGRRRGDAILMGEVNLEYEDVRRFFGDGGDELHMCLNFNLNQSLALSLARGDAGPLIHGLRAMPKPPRDCEWAMFVRNHDEWSLDKLTEAERQEVFRAFGPKPEMQIFGRGLRRRLPTMLDGDQDRIRMTYSLVFSLPGAPVLFYGEEIGMAENLEIPGRLSVRAPMQWEDAPGGGFSTAPPEELRRPVVKGKKWGPAAVNAAEQERDPGSLLNWMHQLIRRRRETPEIAFGTWAVIPVRDAPVFALRYDWEQRSLVVVHNLGASRLEVSLDVDDAGEWSGMIDLFGEGPFAFKGGTLGVTLGRYGYRWFRAELPGRPRGVVEARAGAGPSA
jgi:trehalose synthase